MAYIKNTWVDQEVERPRTYQMNNNADGSVTLVDDFGLVTELGTPVNADYMNHIEDGIAGGAIRLYNATETFTLNEWVKDGDKLYKSKQNSNTGHATSETDWWEEVSLGGNAEWGSITGNIKNQADLISLLPQIGDPILTLSSTLGENEIWLEGATVSRTTYSNLFSIYGTTYGSGDGSTTFNLPSFSNRALWGSTSFGTISAGLPSHKHYMFSNDSNATSVDNRQNMLTATQQVASWWYQGYGAYVLARSNVSATLGLSSNPTSTSIYGKSTTVQPPAIKVRVKTRYQ